MKIKRSITKRLFVNMSMMIVVFTLVLLAANSLLLKPMYIHAIKKGMIDALESIESIEREAIDETWLVSIKNLNIGNDFDAVVIEDGVVIYSASPEFGVRDLDAQSREDGKEPKEDKQRQFVDESSIRIPVSEDIDEIIAESTNHDEAESIMIYSRLIDEGLYVYMMQPLEPVNNSVSVANRLLVICSGVFVALTIGVSMKLASQFTKPVKEIGRQVAAITKLDFTGKVTVTTGDELEGLGNDVNALSETLEKSLNQLNRQNKQLEKDVKSQKSFISNASHELRTPLALIKGYSEEIEAGYVKDQAQQQKYMSYIAEEATKMSRLLDEILELSRLESGRMTLHEETINVRGAVVSFLDKYDGFIREQGLDIVVDVDNGLFGKHDPVRFEQILANFMSNAAKYGDEQKKIIIRGYRKNQACVLAVFNTGEAMKDEVVDHLWDGFYMADEARGSKYNSYGLGLSIVKAIQEVGHNNYGAKNVDGGVEFWIDMKNLDGQID